MNPFEFVLLIVGITTIGGVLRAKYGVHGSRRNRRTKVYGMRMGMGMGMDDDGDEDETATRAENRRLIEEVQQLKDRVKVLERIAVEKEDTLSRQIEELRDR